MQSLTGQLQKAYTQITGALRDRLRQNKGIHKKGLLKNKLQVLQAFQSSPQTKIHRIHSMLEELMEYKQGFKTMQGKAAVTRRVFLRY